MAMGLVFTALAAPAAQAHGGNQPLIVPTTSSEHVDATRAPEVMTAPHSSSEHVDATRAPEVMTAPRSSSEHALPPAVTQPLITPTSSTEHGNAANQVPTIIVRTVQPTAFDWTAALIGAASMLGLTLVCLGVAARLGGRVATASARGPRIG
jgi:hypothetical protein